MLRGVAVWNRERTAAGEPAITISVGLHYGEVVIGDVGSERRLELAVLGDVVNVASRLEAATRRIGAALLVSEGSWPAAARPRTHHMGGASWPPSSRLRPSNSRVNRTRFPPACFVAAQTCRMILSTPERRAANPVIMQWALSTRIEFVFRQQDRQYRLPLQLEERVDILAKDLLLVDRWKKIAVVQDTG